ncbi:calcium-binding protein [Neptuniibacter sp. QD57_21]|uniref:calcium-binding protein n=1 Tax=Neptuniibacter sp. QD57_21 TaxID=3398213 RepID=UPI0039F4F9D8
MASSIVSANAVKDVMVGAAEGSVKSSQYIDSVILGSHSDPYHAALNYATGAVVIGETALTSMSRVNPVTSIAVDVTSLTNGIRNANEELKDKKAIQYSTLLSIESDVAGLLAAGAVVTAGIVTGPALVVLALGVAVAATTVSLTLAAGSVVVEGSVPDGFQSTIASSIESLLALIHEMESVVGDFESVLEQIEQEREEIFDEFINETLPDIRNDSLLNYVNSLREEADLIGVDYQDLEIEIESAALDLGYKKGLFEQQSVVLMDAINKAELFKNKMVDGLDVYNQNFIDYLDVFSGYYDPELDSYIDGEVNVQLESISNDYLMLAKEYVGAELLSLHEGDVDALIAQSKFESSVFINSELEIIGETDVLGFVTKVSKEVDELKYPEINKSKIAFDNSDSNIILKNKLDTYKSSFERSVQEIANVTKNQVRLYVRNKLESDAKNDLSTIINGLLVVVSNAVAAEKTEVVTDDSLVKINDWERGALSLINLAAHNESIDTLSDSAVDNADRDIKLSAYIENAETNLTNLINQKIVELDAISDGEQGDSPALADLTHDDDEVEGTDERDLLNALGGNDLVHSLGGNDYIQLGQGDDEAYSGSGDDTVDGGSGNDYIDTGSGNDSVTGGIGRDQIKGGSGNDYLSGGDDNDIIHAGSGLDTLEGGVGADVLSGGEDDDVIYANTQSDLTSILQANGQNSAAVTDWLSGGAGNDLLVGDQATNGIAGGEGDDTIYGGGGRDFIHADSGAVAYDGDWLVEDINGYTLRTQGSWNVVQYGNDTIFAGSGDDFVSGQGGDDFINGGEGNDELLGDDLITTASGNIVEGSAHGEDYIVGGAGDDSIYGGGRADTLEGGEGDDFIAGDSKSVDEVFHADDWVFGGDGSDTILGQGGSDYLYGGSGDDVIYGDHDGHSENNIGDDQLYGGAGDDTLIGESGDDELTGGTGVDYLEGGLGDDTYLFELGDALLVDGVADSVTDIYGENNTIVFGSGINFDDVSLEFRDEDLLLTYFNEAIWINNGANGVVSSFKFADRTNPIDFESLVEEKLSLSSPSPDSGSDSGNGDSSSTDSSNNSDGNVSGTVTELGSILFDGHDLVATSYNDLLDLLAQYSDAEISGLKLDFIWGGLNFGGVLAGHGSSTLASGQPVISLDIRMTDGQFAGNKIRLRVRCADTAENATNETGDSGAATGDSGTTSDTDNDGTGTSTNDSETDAEGSQSSGTGEATTPTAGNEIDFEYEDRGDLLEEAVDKQNNLDPSDAFAEAKTKGSPIAIDLDRDGVIETLSHKQGIHFDVDANGFAERTGWIDSDDALLVRDLNNDGLITSGSELFGNNTVIESGTKAANGYEALKELDLNDDGVVDLDEAAAAGLKLWRDLNSDGKSQEWEMTTLDNAGIQSLNTNYSDILIDDGKGNTLEQISTATAADGSSVDTADVWFRVNLTDTEEVDLLELSDEIKALPDAHAFGNVHSLQQAMARDDVLKSMILDFIELSPAERLSSMNDIIYQWTGVSDVDPNSRDEYGRVYMDGRKVAALEKLIGRPYSNNIGQDHVQGPQAAGVLSTEFNRFKQYVYSQIISQVEYSEAFDKIQLNFNNEALSYSPNFSLLREDLVKHHELGDETYVKGVIKTLIGISSYSTTFENSLDIIKFDPVLYEYSHELILGTDENDILKGTFGNDSLKGNDGDDVINGGSGNDYIVGGLGDDILNGDHGSDIYIFNRGDGQDQISDPTKSNNDRIILGDGILREHVSIYRNDGDIVLDIADPDGIASDRLTLKYAFSSSTELYRIERVAFADGSLLTHDELYREAQNMYGTEGNDSLVGSNKVDYIYGYGGNDVVQAGSGGDYLYGHEGDDTLKGESGNDRITGGVGNDNLQGGDGSDTYYFNRGDGQDVIKDTSTSGTDKIIFGEGILREHVTITRSGYDIVLTLTDPAGLATDSLTLNNAHNSTSAAYRIEEAHFADGTVLTHDEMYREAQNMYGTEGNDSLVGSNKADYIYGYGGNDVVQAGSGGDYLYGHEGDDTLKGESGNDRITGGVGNDNLQGGADSDTYYFNRGDGQDVIKDTSTSGTDKIIFGEGILREHVTITRSGYDIVLTLTDPAGLATDSLTLNNAHNSTSAAYRIEEAHFADGTVLTHDEMYREAQNMYGTEGNDSLVGSNKADYLFGYSGDDTLKGESGNDRITGGAGNDNLQGGADSDTYYFNRGDGQDVIKDTSTSGTDKIVFGEGILQEHINIQRSGNDILLTITDPEGVATDSIKLISAFTSTSAAYRIEKVQFADGSLLTHDELYREAQNMYGTEGDNSMTGSSAIDYMYGYAGNDTLKGGSGSDRITGGLGNDHLEGSSGSDTYYFNRGDGQDVIKDTSTSGTDKIVFGEGILQEHINIQRSGNDILLTITDPEGVATDSIKLISAFTSTSAAYRIEKVQFADGSLLTHDELYREAQNMYGTEGDNSMTGSSAIDYMYGYAGNDTLKGGSGSDRITGGLGNDHLEGSSGSDIYYFNRGDGQDVIKDTSTSGTDKIIFGEGILREHVTITRSGYDIVLTLTDPAGLATDSLTLNNAHNSTSAAYRIEEAHFADGTVLTHDDMYLATQSMYGTESNDTLVGSSAKDYIYGYGGNDVVQAGSGGDYLYGHEGDDTLKGESGNDRITGGVGNDNLQGGADSDTYYFNRGDGQDVIKDTSTSGTDKIIFGEGILREHVTITRSGYDIVLTLTDPAGLATDSLTLNNAHNSTSAAYRIEEAHFADGTVLTHDEMYREAQNMYGTEGNDSLVGSNKADYLFGYSGDDTLKGESGNDRITGGAGNDNLQGGADSDTYYFNRGDGQDVIKDTSTSGTDKIVFGEGILQEHINIQRSGNDILLTITDPEGVATDSIKLISAFTSTSAAYRIEKVQFADGSLLTHDELYREAQNMYGTEGDNSMTGSSAIDYMYGYAGNDTLKGGSGSDRITGGLGNDHLEGSSGSDIYYFNRGDGQDVIKDTSTSGTDKIIFGEGILREHVTITRSGNDILLTITDPEGVATDSIKLISAFTSTSAAYRIEKVQFADGSLLTHDELYREAQNMYGTEGDNSMTGSSAIDYMYGYAGNDTLKGGSGSDRITGGLGNDHLEGSSGSDIYYFNRGDGQDVIKDTSTSGTDKIIFGEGILREHVTITRSGYDIVLTLTDPAGLATDSLTLNNAHNSTSAAYRIEEAHFADGTVLTHDDMYLATQSMYGTESNDTLVGSSAKDYIYGYGGNDVVQAGSGGDYLYGHEGDDTLKGESGNDRITGGVGNDNLQGGADSDTYYFNRGDGQDVIKDTSTSGTDKIIFGEGILREHVTITRSGYDIVLTLTDPAGLATDSLTLNNAHNSTSAAYRIEEAHFADGTVLTHDEMYREAQNMYGTEGNDSLVGSNKADYLFGYSGDDTLKGESGNDRITGGAGNDNLQGGADSDTYYFNRGDGQDVIKDTSTSGTDKIVFGEGILQEHINIQRSGNDILLTITDPEGVATDSIKLISAFTSTSAAYRIEKVQFADGSLLTHDELYREAQNMYGTEGDNSMTGSSAIDYMYGYAGNDTLKGGSGSDRITGGLGNDHLEGSSGSDTYYFNRGDGQDVIKDTSTSGTDKIVFGEGILQEHINIQRSGNDILLTITDPEGVATDSIKLISAFTSTSAAYRIEKVQFADGSLLTHDELYREAQNMYGTEGDNSMTGSSAIDYMYGYAGNDTLKGGSGSDRITGGLGNDHLEGSSGSDTYYFNRGDGQDVIKDTSTSGTDKIVFGEGILQEHINIQRSENDILLTITDPEGVATDSIKLISAFTSTSAAYRIEKVQFADGSLLTHDELYREAQNMYGTEGDNSMTGSSAIDYMYGYAGNDTLKGGSGSDRITGGLGNDHLEGSSGSDTYYFNRGDGQDVIKDTSTSGTDKIVFGEGILQEHINIQRSGNDILLTITDPEGVATDSIKLISAFTSTSAAYRIEKVQFADGSLLTHDELYREAQNMYGTEGDNSMTGSSAIDYMYGYAGNDTLKGGSGSDRITGGLGNDHLEGSSGSDTYYFNRGDGQDVIKDTSTSGTDKIVFGEGILQEHINIQRSGNDILLTITDPEGVATDSIKLISAFTSTSAAYRIEKVQFADGSLLTHDELYREAQNMYGTEGDNSMTGSSAIDYMYGYAGNDTLKGGSGSDRITGGLGNDYLEGGSGSDIYYFNQGDGQDTVKESSSSSNDQLVLGESISYDNVWFSRSGNDLVIDFNSSTDQVKIQSWYSSSSYEVEQIKASGNVLDHSKVDALVQAMAQFDAPNGVGEEIPQNVKDQLQPVLASSWQPVS